MIHLRFSNAFFPVIKNNSLLLKSIKSRRHFSSITTSDIKSIENIKIKDFIKKNIGVTTNLNPKYLVDVFSNTTKSLEDGCGPIHHIALRGIKFNNGDSTLAQIQSNLLQIGYVPTNSGHMASIKGTFQEYNPNTAKEIGIPKNPYVFSSTTEINTYSKKVQNIILDLKKYFENPEELSSFANNHKDKEIPLSLHDYQSLLNESQYLAWYVTNYLALNTKKDVDLTTIKQPLNHFAYTINNHPTFNTCKKINHELHANNIDVNAQDGKDIQVVHYSDTDTFEQSSTKSNYFKLYFLNESTLKDVPGTYVEFVRHPEEFIFKGFFNAAGLFSSTDNSVELKKKL